MFNVRLAQASDMETVAEIYNQGIEDRVATFETRLRTAAEMVTWLQEHSARYPVLVAECDDVLRGWASVEPFSGRPCYDGVGSLSIYVHREFRGTGIGGKLLGVLLDAARQQKFHKLVLAALANNTAGRCLYERAGFRLVGTYEKQAQLDGVWLDVSLMEKLL